MKQYNKKSIVAVCALGLCILSGTSCVDNLLDQTPKGELAASLYWQTEDDAEYAVNGVYAQARTMFNRDYVFDGNTEYLLYGTNMNASTSTKISEASHVFVLP